METSLDARLLQLISLHRQISNGSNSVWAKLSTESNNEKSINSIIQPDSEASIEFNDGDNIPPAVKNINKMVAQVESIIPGKIPERELRKLWSKQVQQSKRALDHRIWTLKSEAALLQRQKIPSISYDKQFEARNRRRETRETKAKLQGLSSRQRRLISLTAQVEAAIAKSKYLKKSKEYKEQGLTDGLVDKYIEAQRKARLEIRKDDGQYRRNIRNDLDNQIQIRNKEISQKLSELESIEEENDGIRMQNIKEELNAIRELTEDAKKKQRQRISRIEERLHNDWNDRYREDQAQEIEFKFK